MTTFVIRRRSYRDWEEFNYGLCTKCGGAVDSCEPDAEGYYCEECDSNSVSGLMNAILDGNLTVCEDDEEETVSW